jgi:GNAT superfamily N-acetyltransferase
MNCGNDPAGRHLYIPINISGISQLLCACMADQLSKLEAHISSKITWERHFGCQLADDEALDRLLEMSVEDAAKPELFEVYTAMKEHHPKEPHWFLPLIGIDPSAQGKGLGSALMAYGLKACDRDGKLAYLDSTHPRNIPPRAFRLRVARETRERETPACVPNASQATLNSEAAEKADLPRTRSAKCLSLRGPRTRSRCCPAVAVSQG